MPGMDADTERDVPRHLDGKDELNLAEFPLALLRRHQAEDEKGRKTDTIVFESSRYDPVSHRREPQRMTITTSSKLGLPTPADDDVLLALICLSKQQTDFQDARVNFSPRDVFSIVGWDRNSRSYDRLKLVLRRLKGVTITCENAWWDRSERRYREEFGTGIIDSYRLVQQTSGPRAKGQGPASWVSFSAPFFESLRSGNVKTLDLARLFGYSRPISRRMYRLLDKWFYRGPHIDVDLHDFAFGHIGLSGNYATGQIKQKLQPAIDELTEDKFIEPATHEERYERQGVGSWRIRFERHRGEITHDANDAQSTEPAIESPPLANELSGHGVTASVASELVASYAADAIRAKLEVFDWLMERRDKRVGQNPAGYLVASIKDDYQPPKGFKPRAQREAEKEARRRRDEAKRQAEADERASVEQERREQAALLAQFRTLPVDEQEEIKSAALAENPFLADFNRRTPDSMFVQSAVLAEYKRRLTDTGSAGHFPGEMTEETSAAG